MECPRCKADAPLWARYCAKCGAELLRVPPLEAPADAPRTRAPAPGSPAPAPLPLPPPTPRDYRPSLLLGAVLAFASTLVVPPLTGGVAVYLGYRGWRHGNPQERRLGLLVMAAGAVGTVVGLAIALWVDQAGLLTPARSSPG